MAFAHYPLIYPEYALSVIAAIAVGVLFPVMQDIKTPGDRRQYILLQIIMVGGAIIGCKLAVLFGETGWPFVPDKDWRAILRGGRSILGALIFGVLAVEIAKPILKYRLPSNDRFAAVLPFTFAIGRVGCLLHGCCRGIPYDGFCSIRYSDGIPRHAAPAYEMIFDLSAGILFIWMVRKKLARGRLFSIFLIMYGVFRFWTEFIRETPKLYFGWMSGYQALSVLAVFIGVGLYVRNSTGRFRSIPAAVADQLSR